MVPPFVAGSRTVQDPLCEVDFEAGPSPFQDSSGRRIISRISDLRQAIDEGLGIRATDIEAGSALLSQILYKAPDALIRLTQDLDPYDSVYEQVQLALYEKVAECAYSPDREGHDSKDQAASEDAPPSEPMPFYMPPSHAGYWTTVYGHLLHHVGGDKRARILEVGYGSGALTELFVRAGLDVHAVELHLSNAAHLRRRLAMFGLSCETLTGDISQMELEWDYDSIVFFESFHHVPRFRETLAKLIARLRPRGRIFFAAEPIVPEGDPVIPYAWGLRLDGGALSASRDVGWLEVGFQQRFFLNMLAELGLETTEHSLPGYHHSHVIIAQAE